MAYTNQLEYETIRSIDSATFDGTYKAIGTALLHACCIIKMVNNSDVLVTVSVDGSHDHDILPAGSFFLYDNTTNSPRSTEGVMVSKGRGYYVKGSAGTGLVYLVVQYVETR